MSLDIGKAKGPRQIIHSQVKFITAQERDGTPNKHIKIRCVCLKLVNWKYMHRCLYCSVFFCKECAEKHFGKTVKEYKANYEKR